MRRLRAVLALVLGGAFLAGCGPARPSESTRPSEPVVEYVPVAGGTSRPFSAAVRVGSMLYLSGQLGTDDTGRLVSGGIEPETRQTLMNIRRVLEANGSSLDRVVKCTAMLADMGEWEAMNRAYVEYFPRHLPARSAFGASGLARGARIELECLATVGPQ